MYIIIAHGLNLSPLINCKIGVVKIEQFVGRDMLVKYMFEILKVFSSMILIYSRIVMVQWMVSYSVDYYIIILML